MSLWLSLRFWPPVLVSMCFVSVKFIFMGDFIFEDVFSMFLFGPTSSIRVLYTDHPCHISFTTTLLHFGKLFCVKLAKMSVTPFRSGFGSHCGVVVGSHTGLCANLTVYLRRGLLYNLWILQLKAATSV